MPGTRDPYVICTGNLNLKPAAARPRRAWSAGESDSVGVLALPPGLTVGRA